MLKIDKNNRHSADNLIKWINNLEKIEKKSDEIKKLVLQDLENSVAKICDTVKYETDATNEKILNFYLKLQVLTMPVFSWYLECDKSTAETILERIEIKSNSNNIFMVRYGVKFFRKAYTITIKIKNEKNIKHIKIAEFTIDSNIKYNILIDRHLDKHFDSIPELIIFFRNNSLYDSHNVLEMSFRDALPSPIYTAVANTDFEGIFTNYIIV